MLRGKTLKRWHKQSDNSRYDDRRGEDRGVYERAEIRWLGHVEKIYNERAPVKAKYFPVAR